MLKPFDMIPNITNAAAKITALRKTDIIYASNNTAIIIQIPTKIKEAVFPFIKKTAAQIISLCCRVKSFKNVLSEILS